MQMVITPYESIIIIIITRDWLLSNEIKSTGIKGFASEQSNWQRNHVIKMVHSSLNVADGVRGWMECEKIQNILIRFKRNGHLLFATLKSR